MSTEICLNFLSPLIGNAWTRGDTPSYVSDSTLLPLLKKGSKRLRSNNRGIRWIDVVDNAFAFIFLRRFQSNPYQSRFTSGRGYEGEMHNMCRFRLSCRCLWDPTLTIEVIVAYYTSTKTTVRVSDGDCISFVVSPGVWLDSYGLGWFFHLY